MRLKTIFLIVVTILLTVVIMQNSSPVSLKILFFTTYTSKLWMMLWVAIIAFVIGFLAGRPKKTQFTKDVEHGYTEHDDNTHESLTKTPPNKLSDEDRDYISED